MMTEPVTVDLRGLEIRGQFVFFFCFHTTSWRSLQRLQNIVLQHVRTIQGSIIYSELFFLNIHPYVERHSLFSSFKMPK